jgi:hypothetical protein
MGPYKPDFLRGKLHVTFAVLAFLGHGGEQ